MDAKISPKFWSDPDIMDLLPEEQPFIRLTIIWMLTNSDRTTAGIFRRSARKFSFENCLDATWLDRTLDRLPKMFLVCGEKVLIKKFIEYQIGTGDALRKNNQTKGLTARRIRGANRLLARWTVEFDAHDTTSENRIKAVTRAQPGWHAKARPYRAPA